jgi:hypothetical protein
MFVPTNTVHQHVNESTDQPLVLLSGQNRIFRHLGYDNVHHFETAPEYDARALEASRS